MPPQYSKKGIHISLEQKIALVDFLEAHPNLRKAQYNATFGHVDAKQLWDEASVMLNALPGAKKDWWSWRKCWQDLKKLVQRKDSAINSESEDSASSKRDYSRVTGRIINLLKLDEIEKKLRKNPNSGSTLTELEIDMQSDSDSLFNLIKEEPIEFTEEYDDGPDEYITDGNDIIEFESVKMENMSDDDAAESVSKNDAELTSKNDVELTSKNDVKLAPKNNVELVSKTVDPITDKSTTNKPEEIPEKPTDEEVLGSDSWWKKINANAAEKNQKRQNYLNHKLEYMKRQAIALERLAAAEEKIALAKEKEIITQEKQTAALESISMLLGNYVSNK